MINSINTKKKIKKKISYVMIIIYDFNLIIFLNLNTCFFIYKIYCKLC